MKNIYTITEQEKNRILGMHQNATKKQYLMEQDQYTGATGNNLRVENSNKIYSYLEYYCWTGKKDNKNIYSDIINPARPIASQATLNGIHTSAKNFIYNAKEGRSSTFKNYLLDQLKSLNGPSELCEFDRYLRNNGYQSGIHGVLSTIKYMNITWDEVFNALTPALTDAYNIVQGGQASNTPNGVDTDSFRKAIGSSVMKGVSLNVSDLDAMIKKLEDNNTETNNNANQFDYMSLMTPSNNQK